MKAIPNFPGYFATEGGELYSDRTGRLRRLKPFPSRHGYLRIQLHVGNGKAKYKYVHALILETFIGPRAPGMVSSHLNGVNTDNKAANLEWSTQKENLRLRDVHGTTMRGEKHYIAKLSVAKVLEIRSSQLGPRKLAAKFGVSREAIRLVKKGETWKNI